MAIEKEVLVVAWADTVKVARFFLSCFGLLSAIGILGVNVGLLENPFNNYTSTPPKTPRT